MRNVCANGLQKFVDGSSKAIMLLFVISDEIGIFVQLRCSSQSYFIILTEQGARGIVVFCRITLCAANIRYISSARSLREFCDILQIGIKRCFRSERQRHVCNRLVNHCCIEPFLIGDFERSMAFLTHRKKRFEPLYEVRCAEVCFNAQTV